MFSIDIDIFIYRSLFKSSGPIEKLSTWAKKEKEVMVWAVCRNPKDLEHPPKDHSRYNDNEGSVEW